MKRILSIMLVLIISVTSFCISGSEAFASGLVETKPTQTEIESVAASSPLVTSKYTSSNLLGKVFDVVLNYVEELKAAAEESARKANFNCYLHRTFYYIVMSENLLNCSAEPFSEDYYKFYFKRVRSRYDDVNQCNYDISIVEELYPIYVGNVYAFNSTVDVLDYDESLEFVHYKLGFTVGSEYDSYQKFKRFYVSLRGTVSVSFSELPSKLPSEISSQNVPTTVSSQEFVDYVNNNTTSLTTSIPTSSISWKNNPLAVSGYDKGRLNKHLLIMGAGNWFGAGKDLYAMPFVVKDGVTYYSDSVYHMYYGDFTYSVKSGNDYIEYALSDYPMIDKYSSFSSSGDIVDSLYIMPSFNSTTGYTKLSWNEVYSFPSFLSEGFKGFYTGDVQYYMSGLSVVTSLTSLNFFYKNENNLLTNVTPSRIKLFDNFYNASNVGETSTWGALTSVPATETTARTDILTCMEACASNPYSTKTSDGKYALSVDDVPYDYGFLIAPKRFEIGTLMSYLDGSRIPSDSYITINNGDSVYDYSITNSTTGDTTNLGDFINHGYAWINTGSGTQNNQGSGSGNGGGTGGNVTVGGDVNVSGSVDVNVSGGLDINVSISGGGSGGSGGNGNSYDFNTDPMDDYLDYALNESSGIRKFLETFFSFLPPEILTLLGILIVAVIIKVILSSR